MTVRNGITQTTIRKFFTLYLRMLPSKCAFFLHGGLLGLLSFMNVFLVSVGLTKFHAGLVTGIMYVPPIIASPIWGYITDRTGRKKIVLLILCAGSSCLTFPIPWIARTIYPQTQQQCHSTLNSTRDANETGTNLLIDATCGNLENEVVLFWTLLSLVSAASVFMIPLLSFIETLVMAVVKSGPKEQSYGSQRIVGSIGMSLGSFLAGKAADLHSVEDMSPFSVVFYMMLALSILIFPIGWKLVIQSSGDRTHQPREVRTERQSVDTPERDVTYETRNQPIEVITEGQSVDDAVGDARYERRREPIDVITGTQAVDFDYSEETLYKQLFRVFFTWDWIVFMMTVFISGFANNIFVHFSYLYITDVMNRNKTEMTLVMITATIAEAFIFLVASKIRKVLGGNIPSMIVGTLSHFIRFLVMSFEIPFGVMVGVQALSGPGFALSWAVFMEQVHVISPKAVTMTMNAVMIIIFQGASNFIANIVGGKLYEIYGGRKLFFGTSLLCLAWSIMMIMYYGAKRVRTIVVCAIVILIYL